MMVCCLYNSECPFAVSAAAAFTEFEMMFDRVWTCNIYLGMHLDTPFCIAEKKGPGFTMEQNLFMKLLHIITSI